jgi:hypothetical protein
MLRGVLNKDETNSGMLVRQIVTILTGEEFGEGKSFASAFEAAPLGAGEQVNEHEAELKSISEGLAVV